MRKRAPEKAAAAQAQPSSNPAAASKPTQGSRSSRRLVLHGPAPQATRKEPRDSSDDGSADDSTSDDGSSDDSNSDDDERDSSDEVDVETIDQDDLAIVMKTLLEYIDLVPSQSQGTKTARDTAMGRAGWYCVARDEKEDGILVHDVYSAGGKSMAPIRERYYHEVRLLNRFITWHAALVAGMDKTLSSINCPWEATKRPKCVKEEDDPWNVLNMLTWTVNAAHEIRKVAMKWAKAHHDSENVRINPYLHIWATAFFLYPGDFTLSEPRIDEQLKKDPSCESVRTP